MKRLTALLLTALLLAGCAGSAPNGQSPRETAPLETEAPTEAATEYVQEAYIEIVRRARPTATPRPSYPPLKEALATAAPEAVVPEETPAPTPEPVQDGTNIRLTEVKRGEQTLYQMGDTPYLMNVPKVELDGDKAANARRAAQMRALSEAFPAVEFYAYHINRGPTCDWYERFNGIKVFDYPQYFVEQLGLYSRVRFGQFAIPDFDYYRETAYKTDIHINYLGSRRVYEDVYAMMAENLALSPMLVPAEELTFDRLLMVGDMIIPETTEQYDFSEEELDEFKAYRYDLPAYTSYVNDKPVVLGLEAEYAAGEIDRTIWTAHQFSYYGGQTGMIRLEFAQPDRPNLLMLSDSQGRPSRLPLASHFNTTLYLDYEASVTLDLNALIEQYDIDAVLLIGQISMFEVWGQ